MGAAEKLHIQHAPSRKDTKQQYFHVQIEKLTNVDESSADTGFPCTSTPPDSGNASKLTPSSSVRFTTTLMSEKSMHVVLPRQTRRTLDHLCQLENHKISSF